MLDIKYAGPRRGSVSELLTESVDLIKNQLTWPDISSPGDATFVRFDTDVRKYFG